MLQSATAALAIRLTITHCVASFRYDVGVVQVFLGSHVLQRLPYRDGRSEYPQADVCRQKLNKL
jgi:hypothetical protein